MITRAGHVLPHVSFKLSAGSVTLKVPVFFNQDAESFRDMQRNLTEYLDKSRLHKNLWYHYKPHELVNKILRDNTVEFFRRNF